VVTNNNIFTSANLASLLPSTFPGFPASGGIAPIMENPAQPLLWFTNAAKMIATNYVGNSAVLKCGAQICPARRPANERDQDGLRVLPLRSCAVRPIGQWE
jgi:hypothetical protein